MKEIEKKTMVIITKVVCDCGGDLIEDTDVLLTFPPTYKYVCNKCGRVEHLKTKYPRTKVEEVKNERSNSKRLC